MNHLRDVLSKPERMELFVTKFRRRYDELLSNSGSAGKELDSQIARQRTQVDRVMAALVTVPGSRALGDHLQAEERKLRDLEAQRHTVTDLRPKVMPPPKLIADYVTKLLETLDTDVAKAPAILTRALRPFLLTPEGSGYRISGALDLSAVLPGARVCEQSSSGGVI